MNEKQALGYVKKISHMVSFFTFCLNEVLTDTANLPLKCQFSGNRVNIFCYADDIALLVPTENALQYMLFMLALKL